MTINDNEQKESKNILFLTLLDFSSLDEKNIYTDLLREIRRHGNKIYVVSPSERKNKNRTHIIKEHNSVILKLRIGNIQKTNIIEKGISTVLIEPQFKKAIRKYFNSIKFDLVLYSTPPISFVDAVKYVKDRDSAKSYLLLKDIFPQNAVDIGMMSTSGIKGLLYRFFRKKEKELYEISDRIGCMSPANIRYLLSNNHKIDSSIVELCPNSIEPVDKSVDDYARKALRTKYKIPLDKTVLVYGGNLGKPQGIPFLIDCLRACKDIQNAFFIIVGDGTEFHLIKEYIHLEQPKNVRLIKRLPKEDYDAMVGACDVGLIFLDHRFTIPNFPSRLLSYMQAKLPVLACTDTHTDVGKVIVDGGFGWWCESNDVLGFVELVENCLSEDCSSKGRIGYEYLLKHYTVENAYNTIIAE